MKIQFVPGLITDARDRLHMSAFSNQSKIALESVGGRAYRAAFALAKTHYRQKLIGSNIIFAL